MKRVNPLIALCLIAVMAMVAASCSKEGPTGPAGPAGPAGTAGPAGAAGAAGPAGTANVIYSGWLDVAFTSSSSTPGDTTWTGIIPATKLDNTMLNTGEIKVYINWGTSTAQDISPLPYFDGGILLNPEFTLQKIYLFSNVNASTFTNSGSKYAQYRYILIPGGTNARSMVDWNNYAEVQKYLGLKD
jgi:hypothetical protein